MREDQPPGEAPGLSFVLVLWLEQRGDGKEPEWRWRVTHAPTGEQAYFRCLADVLDYVSVKSGGVSPPS